MKKILLACIAAVWSLQLCAQTVNVWKDGQVVAAIEDADSVVFKAPEAADMHNGHQFVDLGLSCKWATMNVDATSAADFGGYYAFYNADTDAYDAKDAAEAWGAGWRLPTVDECNELVNDCEWAYDEETVTYTVTGPNGNQIVLPIGGYGEGEKVFCSNLFGYFWTSYGDTVGATYLYVAIDFSLGSPKVTGPDDAYLRCSVRPVF